jgi:hypothetical protein
MSPIFADLDSLVVLADLLSALHAHRYWWQSLSQMA